MGLFDDLLRDSSRKSTPLDLSVAFSIWAEKQPFHAKLPQDKKDKITISAKQILLLMREAYKAGYNRSKL